MTLLQRNFCSITAVQLAENLFATTPVMHRFLLIEYNYAWEEKVLETSTIIPDEVKAFLDTGVENGDFSRIFLVKNGQSNRDSIHLFLVNNRPEDPFAKQLCINNYQDLLAIDFRQEFANETDRLPEPMYLVCTHGKVDMCCSKFGLPIYKRLIELGADVWQCTHVTGDRFAPNVVQVPSGHYYGHLQLDEIEPFYDTLQSNQLYFTKYRGQSWYSKPQQAADYFLRKHLADFQVDSLTLVKSEVLSDDSQKFIFSHRDRQADYALVIQYTLSEPVYVMNCKATEKKPVDLFNLLSLTKLTQLPSEEKPSRYHYTQLA
ncbi:hypothetical protein GO755_28280 [Spirosoma sp. HMF4905]|uniref:Sucrase ferredoxin n=1 Tax=Spirosoma arboris TaxID=2682092 RepID=A0A7K1SK47_9BACT|nr:sucrase ferredoxin [Spirosoma arboris]MVM33966.1 hypothetical protein [Spirosoma arboris]